MIKSQPGAEAVGDRSLDRSVRGGLWVKADSREMIRILREQDSKDYLGGSS